MARVELTIRRDNGVQVSASGEVADELVADIAMTLGAILFDASAAPLDPPAADPATATATAN
jgi:hypothetical protein